ncbi:MAG: hypothetical protein JWQ02_1492 [Capsulimonas sp.]|nr:hypothetical protein [Capsulimonas sp.]
MYRREGDQRSHHEAEEMRLIIFAVLLYAGPKAKSTANGDDVNHKYFLYSLEDIGVW